jgi:hypothetical protein
MSKKQNGRKKEGIKIRGQRSEVRNQKSEEEHGRR